jgi:hypothetical protein
VAEAVMEPLLCPIVGFTVVAVTTTEIPAQGFEFPRATVVTPVQPFEFFAVMV